MYRLPGLYVVPLDAKYRSSVYILRNRVLYNVTQTLEGAVTRSGRCRRRQSRLYTERAGAKQLMKFKPRCLSGLRTARPVSCIPHQLSPPRSSKTETILNG